MAEVLVTFTTPTKASNGDLYHGRVLGRVATDGLWEGWLEFAMLGSDEVVLTERETGQPNRADLKYWAEGLSDAYLEGALNRALNPTPAEPRTREEPAFAKSAPRRHKPVSMPTTRRVVLDPFLTYAEGEELLRGQLNALSRDHLQNIVEGYGFVGVQERDWARLASADAMTERIVERVRARYEGATAPGTESEREAAPQTSTEERPSV
jgi:hypothetical protein